MVPRASGGEAPQALAQTGGVATPWLPLAAITLIAGGALLTLRRRTV